MAISWLPILLASS
jgi:hypothetical protein